MKRLYYVAIAVAGVLLVTWAGWRFFPRSTPTHLHTRVSSRPPELYGVIEQMRTVVDSIGTYQQFLIRCRQPPAAVPESAQNQWQRKIDLTIWVWINPNTGLSRRDGGLDLTIMIGQTASAWCTGPMAMSNPPQWPAERVVIEADAK